MGYPCELYLSRRYRNPDFLDGSEVAQTLDLEEKQRKMEKLERNLVGATPLAGAELARDVANAALFLARDAASFVNCHELVVDGGRTSVINEKA